MATRWKRRPEGSTWGDFGEDDQLGRLNLLTPEKVRAGIAEVKEGRSFCLSLPLDYPGGAVLNPRRHPPRLSPTLQDGCPCLNFPLARLDARNTDVLSDDEVTLALQYSTQWDSFAHVGAFFDVAGNGVKEKVYYNGYRANEHVVGPRDYQPEGDRDVEGPYGAHALGVANMARKAIQGRAVMIDLKHHFGLERHYVGYDDLMRVLDQDRIDVLPGDMLVLRTGFTEVLVGMNRNPDGDVLARTAAVLDGRDEPLLQWISDSQVAAICADNYAVEGLPALEVTLGQRPALPLHQHCLFKLGVPLAELWWLAELADWLRAHQRSAFLLTAPPLYLPGAVGSPVTPVATV
ncbi:MULTISPECIES: cyclase family protein [unclassified Cupriavidus]|uniref:cyclase family protein n=1 Tax=Cupriavidus sp. H19C3 TaxID=3241603 RepID=UPI003BF925D8